MGEEEGDTERKVMIGILGLWVGFRDSAIFVGHSASFASFFFFDIFSLFLCFVFNA